MRNLKVHGLDNLYVVDASVFPNVTSGNTHAPTTMVAHKGAEAILAAHGADHQTPTRSNRP
jgi:choline dehydrogenase